MAKTETTTTKKSTEMTTLISTPLGRSKTLLVSTSEELKRQAIERLKSPDLMQTIINDVHTLGVVGEDNLIGVVYLIGTSRLLAEPLAGVVMAQSGSGKSYVVWTVVMLIPDEAVLKAHVISPKVLYRMKEGELEHRFVAFGERSRRQDEEAVEITKHLRQLLSDGELNAVINVPGGSGGWQPERFKQKGPISYIETTTLNASEIFAEDRTRFILLRADESMEQTRAIINQQARSACDPIGSSDSDNIRYIHHTMQRLLKPYTVVVPFAEELTDAIPPENVVARRTFPQMLGLIQATALLHQFRRGKDNKGRIIATVEDYNLVKERFSDIIARSIGGVISPDAVALLEQVRRMPKPPYSFSVSDLVGKANFGETKLRSLVNELLNAGQISEHRKAAGRKAALYVVPANPPSLNALALPVLESDMSRYQIAKISGLSEAQLSYFVNDKRSLTLPAAAKLTKVLGLELVQKKE